jgi:hypothetical protein
VLIKTEPAISLNMSTTPINTMELFQSSACLTEPDRQVIAKFVSQDPLAASKWPNMKIKLNESIQV